MLHEIQPRVYHPEYIDKKARLSDYALCYRGNAILFIKNNITTYIVESNK